MISVTMVGANTYEVVVDSAQRAGAAELRHRVTLAPAYYRQLSGGAFSHEWVIVQAFRFLLERIPGREIAAELDLGELGERFPDFEQDIARRLSQR